ncbi:Hypothetical protein POVR1_LOCUS240 [uncultured virus]|nr:Hypothetical protein POVR1_LOCUS240 [uncultured virus]
MKLFQAPPPLLKFLDPDEKMIEFLMALSESGLRTQVVQNIINSPQIRKLGYRITQPEGSGQAWKHIYYSLKDRNIRDRNLLKDALDPYHPRIVEILLDTHGTDYHEIDQALYLAVARNLSSTSGHKLLGERIINKILTDNYQSDRYTGLPGLTYAQQALVIAMNQGYD